MSSVERFPGSEILIPLVDVLAGRFIQRWDLHAKQHEDGNYTSIRRPLRKSDLYAHLRGDITLGAYVLDQESMARYLVLDADDAPDWRRLKALATVLAEEGTTGYLESSRRGGHLWFFLEEPMSGAEIRRFGAGLLGYFGIEGLELFPKQEKLTSGPGSLIRLPFGVHRRSGRRYGFYLPDGTPLAPSLREQIHVLRDPETLSKPVLDRFMTHASTLTPRRVFRRFRRPRVDDDGERDESLPGRIKAELPIRHLILRHVELTPAGMGLCPFHDDHNPSFSVSDAKDFWYCFACEIGGDVIDFYMKYHECDFATAVNELAELIWQ